jgi:hypothetical protein
MVSRRGVGPGAVLLTEHHLPGNPWWRETTPTKQSFVAAARLPILDVLATTIAQPL